MTDVFEIVAAKTSGLDVTQERVAFAVDEAESFIKNYCHLGEVPDELSFVHANMAVDLLVRGRYSAGAGETPDGVTEMRIGDMSVKLAGTDPRRGPFEGFLHQLAAYRRTGGRHEVSG